MGDTAKSERPSRAFIESDRIEGTAVHGPDGAPMGRVRRMIIEKVSGRVAYVVIAIGEDAEASAVHTVPWGMLRYDPAIAGFRSAMTEDQLHAAPAFARSESHDWWSHEHGDELDAFYEIPPHLRAI
jgi:hypothetical protein